MNSWEAEHLIRHLDDLVSRDKHNDETLSQEIFRSLKFGINFDSAVMNFCLVEQDFRLPELKSFYYKQPQTMALNYQKTSQSDNYSPNLLLLNGKALDGLSCLDVDQYLESPFYLDHCRYFDVQNALGVAGRFPGHMRKYLVLYLFASDKGRLFSDQDVTLVDRVFPIIFLIWQCRYGLICHETLINRIQLLELFANKPRMLELIRLVVQNPFATAKEYARQMQCSERTVEHQFSALFDMLNISGYNKNKKIELYQRFQFLAP